MFLISKIHSCCVIYFRKEKSEKDKEGKRKRERERKGKKTPKHSARVHSENKMREKIENK